MMERKFYTDSFEKLLKENADQFKMYPSNKVWHGLYNNLHPGRRWPSITISILFLFSLVIVGHLNTGNNRSQKILASNKTFKQVENKSNSKFNLRKSEANTSLSNHETENIVESTQPLPGNLNKENSSISGILTVPAANNALSSGKLLTLVNQKSPPENITSNVENPGSSTFISSSVTPVKTIAENEFSEIGPKNELTNNSSSLNNQNNETNRTEEKFILTQANPIKPNNSFSGTELKETTRSKNITSSTPKNQDNTTSETNQISSSIIPRIKKENLSWSYYISPSISYRKIKLPVSNVPALNGPIVSVNGDNIPTRQYPSVGIEAGTAVNYKVFKKLQLITGIQFNYSRFNIIANNIHPTMASLLLNNENSSDPYSLTAISVYGNGTGNSQTAEVKLHNYSLQASIPIGLQYELFGNDKIKLHATATFQPSLILANQSYILSTDKRNYLTDKDLLRGWNMNTNLGTYITFSTNTFNWQIGPQLRYQILSTYISNYPGKEHLLDYGLRFGVSKRIN